MVLRIIFAVVVFVVFGGVSIVMGRSTLRDVRNHHDEGNRWMVGIDLQELVPAVIAGIVAVLCPVVILLGM